MNSIENVLHDLSIIAPAMNRLHKQAGARVLYDDLSGSLFWTDEWPQSPPVSTDCLRFVFNYRTGLLIGKPMNTWLSFWQEAKRCFPDWIGFLPERVAYNEGFARLHEEGLRRVQDENLD
jgi:hypothetical protein